MAASAGLVLDPWQGDVLVGALGERADGRWVAPRVVLVVPRQNGKNAILEARELAGLFLFGEKLITHTAHRVDASLEHFVRMRALIENTPDLAAELDDVIVSHGKESIVLRGGRRLNFKARTKVSGRAFSGDCVVLDEALYLTELSSLIPTMAARPNPQLWYTSSAPQARVESDRLRRLCVQGRAAAEGESVMVDVDGELGGGLAYFEWCAEFGDDPDDLDILARANPALGIRLDLGFIRGVERQDLTAEEFAVERLGIWEVATDVGVDRIIPDRRWEQHSDTAKAVAGTVVLAVDAAPDLAWASIAVSDGRCVEVIENRIGGAWLPRSLAALVERHRPAMVVIDPHGPAGVLVDQIEACKVALRSVTASEYRRACGVFLAAVSDDSDDSDDARVFWHRDQPVLNAAVAAATRRRIGDGWGWARRSTSLDISPLVAVTLAYWAASVVVKRPAVGGVVDDDAYTRVLAQIEEEEARVYEGLDAPVGE